MIKLLAFNFDQVFVAKPNFLEKLDRMVSTFSVQFPKQMNEAIANLKVLFQKFLVYAEAHPWLMPSLIVGGIVLVLWWLYYSLCMFDSLRSVFVALKSCGHLK